ncbi:MAG: hypothetical protein KF862_19560 [Chitinophagaceae bacterium]|nr:hypothetical protein [Chitinophagaceae bacterium]
MTRLLFLAFFLFTLKLSYCQVTKQNWLLGGTGQYNSGSLADTYGNESIKEHNIQIQPNIGYFFVDKLAVGIRINIALSRHTDLGNRSNMQSNSFGFGPFIRYYILNSENRINFLTEGSYQYQFDRKNVLGFAGGPVIYFNRSVGLEFLAGYTFTDYVQNKSNIKNFYVGIGLQVHLEKE